MTFSINARAPVIRQAIDSYHERLDTSGETFSSTINIGYDNASFVLRGDVAYLREWFTAGLGRDVVWKGEYGGTVWEGFVSSMTLYEGGENRTRSLGEMYNKITLYYPLLDTSSNPPTVGAQTTAVGQDSSSQARYGIKELSLSSSQMTAAAAAAAVATEVKKKSFIGVKRQFASGTNEALALTVSMMGYGHMLGWYRYTQTGSSGTADTDAVITAVLAADPNSVLSTATTNIDSNTLAAERYHDGSRTGLDIIKMLTERGDASGNRWTFGVYEGRKLTYKQAETADSRGNLGANNKRLAIYRNPHDPADDLIDGSGRKLEPWEVRPDMVEFTTGVPGYKYIEQVQFSAPYGLSTRGADENPFRGVL